MVAVVASSATTSTNNTDAISVTVNKPTGTLQGHLMIAVTHGFTSDSFTPPSGWTFLNFYDDATNLRSRAYMKLAGSSEPASYVFSFQPGPGGGTIGVSITTFSGHGGLDSYAAEVNGTTDPWDWLTGWAHTPSRNGLAYEVLTWRDTTSDSVTWTGATELFDVNAGDAGLTQYRGQTGAWETTTAGSTPSFSANITNSITHSIGWVFFIADAVPANESWSSTGNTVELEINNTWVDVTSDVRYEQAVSITRGTSSQGGQVNPSTASFTLDNITGKYSVLNPTSTYYPYLNLTVPCRISKAYGTVAMETLGFYDVKADPAKNVDRFRTPHYSGINITGDIDIRVDCEPKTWKMQQVLAAKHSLINAGGLGSEISGWVFYIDSMAIPHLFWVEGVAGLNEWHDVAATACVPSELRQSIRVTLDVNNGSSGHTVTFYTASTIDGSYTQLGSAVTISGTTDINGDNTTALTVGAAEPILDGFPFTYYTDNVVRVPASFGNTVIAPIGEEPVWHPFRGRIYGMQLRSGIAGTTVASCDFTAQTTGTKSFTDAQSNLWTAYGYVLCHNRKYRHHGEITSWPQPRDITGNEAWVDIESTGVLNREQQGTPAESSALYRKYTATDGVYDKQFGPWGISGDQGPFYPAAYWPMEDNVLPGAIEGESPDEDTGSGLSDQRPGKVTGTIEFGSDTTWYGATSAAKFTTNSMIRFPVLGATPGAFVVEFIIYAPDGITNGSRICEVRQSGADGIVRLTYSATDTLVLDVLSAGGTLIDTSGSLSVPMNRKHNRIAIVGWMGAYQLFYENQSDRGWTDSGAFVSGTATERVTDVVLNANGTMNGVYLGHLAVFGGEDSDTYPYGQGFGTSSKGTFVYRDLDANSREVAPRRAERLSWEHQLINYNIGDDGPGMGIQSPKNFADLMQEVQATDIGYLIEPRQVLGIGYRNRLSMFNQPAMLTLSYEGNDLSGTFSPVRDNRGSVNDMTVFKETGTSARYVKASGTRSVLAPPDGIGRYRDEATISLYDASKLGAQAQWRVFVGTNDDLRVDTVTVALENPRIGGDSDTIYRFLTADIGDRLALTDLPDLLLPDDMDLVVAGYSETFDQFQHSITFYCVPGSTFNIGKAVITTSTTVSKADSLTTTLNEDLDTTETGVDVAITSGSALWTTSGVDFDIIVGGERMTVTSVSGSSSPQTFTVTRSVNGVVKTHSTGAQVKLFRPAIAGL